MTNLKRRSIDKALISRSLNIDFDLDLNDSLAVIKAVLKTVYPEIRMEVKLEVYNYILSIKKDIKDIDIRQFKKALSLKLTEHPKWKTWVKAMLSSM